MQKESFKTLLELLAINLILLALILYFVPVLTFWIFIILAGVCYWRLKKL